MQIVLALLFLGFLVRRNIKVKKRRKQHKELLNKIVERLGMNNIDESSIDAIVKKGRVKQKTPEQIEKQYSQQISDATVGYKRSREDYIELTNKKTKKKQELEEKIKQKERLDALIRKYADSEQHKDTLYFYAKEAEQLGAFINERKIELFSYDETINESKKQYEEYHVKLNALQAQKNEDLAKIDSINYLTHTFQSIMKRNKEMDKNFDISEIIESINNSKILFENTKLTYDTDPYHQRKKMERESDRALAEEYIKSVLNQ